MVAISPQLEEHSRTLIKEKSLTFDLLGDPGNQVAQQFGLVYKVPDNLRQLYLQFGINLEHFNGDDSWSLPMPARFIVDQESAVRYSEADPDYTIRPDPKHTIDALKAITR